MSHQGSLVFVDIVIIPLQYGSVPSRHNLCQFLCPGSRNPVFCPVVRFFKKYIFGIYMLGGVSGCKKFPGQIWSGVRFCSETMVFQYFSLYIIYIHTKQTENNIFMSLTFPGRRNPDFLSKIRFFKKYIFGFYV